MRNSSLIGAVLLCMTTGSVSITATAGADSVNRGKAEAFSCTNCHGYNGMGTRSAAALAGRDETELRNKLQALKRKKASIMSDVLERLDDETLNSLAVYFSSLKKTKRGIASYARDIQPIIEWRCISCHTDNGIGEKESGLNLGSYQALINGTSQGGKLIQPGDPARSNLFNMVTRRDHLRMPFGAPPLADDEIRVITTWIKQGAANN